MSGITIGNQIDNDDHEIEVQSELTRTVGDSDDEEYHQAPG
jgi:hypothetical protein